MRSVLLGCLFLLPVVHSASTVPRSKPKSSESEEEIDWQCGTDSFTKYISENQIDIDCPKLKKTVNQCCLDHDDCYDQQKGRKFCDDTFCKCLEIATKPSKVCSKEDGPLFCNLVRDFGADAYRRSAKNETAVIENEPLVHEIEENNHHNETELENDYESQVSGLKDSTIVHLASADSYTEN